MGLGILPPPGVAPPKAPDVQDFTTSGTWTKPEGAKWVLFEGVGGGAGANSTSGGGGGNRVEFLIPADALGASESVTVGAGGGNNSPGGATTFAGFSSGLAKPPTGNAQNRQPNGIFDGGLGGATTTGATDPGSSQYGAGGGRGQYNSASPGGLGGLSGDTSRLLGGNGADASTPPGIPGGGGSSGFASLDGASGAARITTYF